MEFIQTVVEDGVVTGQPGGGRAGPPDEERVPGGGGGVPGVDVDRLAGGAVLHLPALIQI